MVQVLGQAIYKLLVEQAWIKPVEVSVKQALVVTLSKLLLQPDYVLFKPDRMWLEQVRLYLKSFTLQLKPSRL